MGRAAHVLVYTCEMVSRRVCGTSGGARGCGRWNGRPCKEFCSCLEPGHPWHYPQQHLVTRAPSMSTGRTIQHRLSPGQFLGMLNSAVPTNAPSVPFSSTAHYREHSTKMMLVPLNILIAYSCAVKISVEYTLISPEEIAVGMK